MEGGHEEVSLAGGNYLPILESRQHLHSFADAADWLVGRTRAKKFFSCQNQRKGVESENVRGASRLEMIAPPAWASAEKYMFFLTL
jgi:hypothetical protein